MSIKIIKHGTSKALKVQPFFFSEGRDEPTSDAVEPYSWTEHSPPAMNAIPSFPKMEVPVQEQAISSSQNDLAQIEKTAYENGFRQGERAGMEIAEKKVEAAMRRYAEAILEMGRLKSALYSQVEREVVKLSVEVAKKIVHREIQADKEIIQTLVKVALSHVAEKSAVTVRINPVDYNYILEHKTELSQGEQNGREIVLLADKTIERGGCLIQTECGDIDARIEEEFREVERGFFEGLK
jgi:flagellar assembly protein FliH